MFPMGMERCMASLSPRYYDIERKREELMPAPCMPSVGTMWKEVHIIFFRRYGQYIILWKFTMYDFL